MVAWAVLSGFFFSGGVSSAQDGEATADIPVRRVVLFSSGVGFFEHAGEVEGEATARLTFRTEEINDILKSMVVMDASGNSATVQYASRDPLERALRSFAVDLSNNPDLAGLLQQIRGAGVVVSAPEEISGTILGLETRTRQVHAPGDSTILQETYLNLMTNEGIVSLPLATVRNLRIREESLRSEMEKALRLILSSRDKQRRSVEVRFGGQGRRAVRIGYITETPVWKASYRLELSGAEPFLQGWAIVENTSDQDWSDVQLSLVSGRPISFVQELYTPLYLPRPVVQPELYASLRPREYEQGAPPAEAAPPRGMPAPSVAPSAMAPRWGAGRKDAVAAEAPVEYDRNGPGGTVSLDAVSTAAVGGNAGELFSFTIKAAVSLARQQSAMLPIVSAPIKARKVSIYNPSVMPKHPLHGAWISNTTGMKLPAGPVTVFDEKMYAGDARLGSLGEKDKRLISYALDMEVLVDSSRNTHDSVVAAAFAKGIMTLTYKRVHTQTYAIRNNAGRGRTLVLEHPFQASRTLVQPKEYAEKTPDLYRFETSVASGQAKEFVVAEEEIRYQTVRLVDQNEDILLYYSRTAQLSEPARKALQQAAAMKARLANEERRLEHLRREKASIEAGQDRLRRNIAVVGRDTPQGKDYILKLARQEAEIENLEKEIQRSQTSVENIRNELATFLNEMKF